MIAGTGMRRGFLTLGLGIAGLFLGLKGQDTSGEMWMTALGGIWGGGIGYGFGTIFDQKNPTKRIVIYWAATLALVGPFFGLLIGAGMQPYASVVRLTVAGITGSLVGMLFGFLVGTLQLKRLRRRSQTSESASVV